MMQEIHVAIQYFLNGELEPERIRRQVRELAAAGYRCIFGHARQGMLTPYLSEKWWRAIDVIVAECEALGIRFAIWDEDYYPSPSAGNRVMWEHPEFAAQQLKFTVFEAQPGRVYRTLEALPLVGCYAVTSSTIRDVSGHCGTVCDQWNFRGERQNGYSDVLKVGAPHWRAGMTHRCFALDWTAPEACTVVAVQLERNFGEGHNVDVLNADAVRAFLGTTHEQYLARYGQERFDRVFAGTFLDEPAPWGTFPWTTAYPAEFQRRFGADLLPLLPHLVLDIDDTSRLVRFQYREVQRELLCRNYLQIVQKWCAEHHILSIGHLSRTEHLSVSNYSWPNELYCCRFLNLPCTDPLGANMGWPDTASYHTGLKVVSSAAYWSGKPQAGSDALAVCGSETALCDLRAMADYQMAFGISFFNLHGAALSWAGPRKDEVPPSLFYQHTQWPLMPELWKHLEDSCRRLTRGREHVQFAVYYPAAQFVTGVNGALDRTLERNVHLLMEALLSSHKEFALIDGATLCEQDPAGFARRYPFLVIPEGVTFFEPGTTAFFRTYEAAGGNIVRNGNLAGLPGVKLQGPGAENVFVHRRELADGTLDAYLFNRADTTFRGTLEGRAVEVPPRSGCFAAPPRAQTTASGMVLGPWRVTFADNMVPLCRFNTTANVEADLLRRRPCPIPEDGRYLTRFMAQGNFTALTLITDAEMATLPCRILLNGQVLAAPVTRRFYDEENQVYDLLPYLRTRSVPTQNVLCIECAGELREMSFLVGSFHAEFRHGGEALPYLTGAGPVIAAERLADWREWGYGAYSGCATYETAFTVPVSGAYRLALGRVASAAEIRIDGQIVATRYSEPYDVDLPELAAGKHTLTLTVYNDPGNRDRLSGRPAGLLGPAQLNDER